MSEAEHTPIPGQGGIAIGERYGRLIALEYTGKNYLRKALWLFRCDCGIEKIIKAPNVRNGSTRSCGCYHREQVAIAGRKTRLTHGMTHTPEWRAWLTMRQRCNDPNNDSYPDYGGRGITVCDRWQKSFENFYADMGPRPSNKYSLDRIDNNGNYEPNNCRWAVPSIQGSNKRNNRFLTYQGRTQTIWAWSKELNIRSAVLYQRINRGWSTEEALTASVLTYATKGGLQLTFDGKTMTTAEWAHHLGVSNAVIRHRLERGWPLSRALSSVIE